MITPIENEQQNEQQNELEQHPQDQATQQEVMGQLKKNQKLITRSTRRRNIAQ
ncbi:hypothetical protein [Psychrobacter sp. ENNN9_III]|uniref:hypothetical protein n=1 Tax=Psychrobacter sp. ENNN9_III TaxID=1254334 RepID=UPI000A6365C0|nr:hypothetical protein [Psychrobacter sp. ENNN9_III]